MSPWPAARRLLPSRMHWRSGEENERRLNTRIHFRCWKIQLIRSAYALLYSGIMCLEESPWSDFSIDKKYWEEVFGFPRNVLTVSYSQLEAVSEDVEERLKADVTIHAVSEIQHTLVSFSKLTYSGILPHEEHIGHPQHSACAPVCGPSAPAPSRSDRFSAFLRPPRWPSG